MVEMVSSIIGFIDILFTLANLFCSISDFKESLVDSVLSRILFCLEIVLIVLRL